MTAGGSDSLATSLTCAVADEWLPTAGGLQTTSETAIMTMLTSMKTLLKEQNDRIASFDKQTATSHKAQNAGGRCQHVSHDTRSTRDTRAPDQAHIYGQLGPISGTNDDVGGLTAPITIHAIHNYDSPLMPYMIDYWDGVREMQRKCINDGVTNELNNASKRFHLHCASLRRVFNTKSDDTNNECTRCGGGCIRNKIAPP